MTTNTATPKTAYSEINNLVYRSYLPNIISAAIDIGVFDELRYKPMSCAQITDVCGADERIMDALLEVLLALTYLEKDKSIYKLSPLADEFLTQASEFNQLGAIKQFTTHNGPLANLTEALKGNIVDFDQHAWSNESAMRGIEQGTKAGALQNVLAFVKEIPEFKRAKKMCDFAGNSGYYSYAFLNENPDLHAHVYDLEQVCKIALQIKKDEKNYNRVSYHSFDLIKGDDFGCDYDFFFSSHFLYKYDTPESLACILKRINKSMKIGALFVSNHISGGMKGDHHLTLCIVELITRSMGFPTHCLKEDMLRKALLDTGFEIISTKAPNYRLAYPELILAARKIQDV
ncbi:methyltransferase family protein [Marinifilum sp.]|uniref:methyltransferase family protein n=1 Tax=Marinifilum sp. TaxID=2033137 RepID=UPI003BAD24E8